MQYSLSEIKGLIKHRRTIYPEQYSERKVHKEIVESLLEAARWAPNHGMTQPWRFIVYMNESRMALSEGLSQLYRLHTPADQFNEMKFAKLQNRSLKSSVCIALWMQPDPNGKITEMDEMLACACAVQNMSLVAAAYDLGLFWSTPKLIHHPDINQLLEIPENAQCLGILYIGYPNMDWPKGQRRPIEYFTTWK